LHELPFTSRNLTELIVTQPGTATPSIPRSSSMNGLPKGAFNITLDGINIQDNANKSGDGFFNSIFPRADAIEEMTVTTAAAGADNTGEGAAQIKFVTRSGTNDWHGGLFWYHRNTYFNANYYFNNIDRLPRDRVLFNQVGGLAGGPIKKNRLFLFAHYEAFRLPQTYASPNQTILTPEARQGSFSYRDTVSGQVRTVNLYALAAARNQSLPAAVRPFPTTPDPILAGALDKIAQLTSGTGNLRTRVDTNTDYNRYNYNFQTPGKNDRDFPTLKLDWNATAKHHIDLVYNYQINNRLPDGLNSAIPIFPNTGIVLNSPVIGNQKGIVFSTVASLRSAFTSRLTSEIRYGFTGGKVIFNDGVAPADFEQWRGYAPAFNYVTNPFRSSGQSRRNTPIRQGNINLTWSRSAHLLNFGGSFTQINTWNAAFNNSQFTPGISFAAATGDPVNTGATSLFTAANFPNSTPANLTDAAALYTLLTGRVSSITRNVILGEDTKTYGPYAQVDRNRQREYALFIQDSWRMRPGLTLNYGVRWDHQNPYENLNGLYTRPGYEGVWGISGVGNLFNPYANAGKPPAYYPIEPGTAAYNGKTNFSPSLGLAWVLPKPEFTPLSWLLGRGQSVLRAGYSISTVREDLGRLSAVWGANQGRTVNASVDPNNFPTQFGPAGSVWFRDPSLPLRPVAETPSYPIPVLAGNAVRDFDPNLRVGYVQSWTLGLQRELTRDTVLEVRYVANHGTGLWRQIDLNEVNIFENGFLEEFRIAQANL
ncbi:MAG: TonB-dependent receptor domain-containing protein, partial [Bryobacteraceae bacterium]